MTFADIRWDLFLGGLGLFLFGIVLMGDGLKSFAGDKLRDYIDKYTSKPWQGILIGCITTAIIQSSSATTAITIGFVRAGLMTLEQAAGIIIGANIGTTMTAFLIGLNVEGLAVYFIIIGALMLMFAKCTKMQDLGHIIIGFGILFYGISLIGDTLVYLKDVQEFQQFANMCTTNPLIGLFGGIIMTCAMQSSSAAIGVIQIIYETGAIPFIAIIPFLYGSNIGTCITAIMAAMGGNPSAKRAAVLHLGFNIIGATLGMFMLTPLSSMMAYFTEMFNIQPMMQIAIVHIIFNVATAIIVFPFIKQICAIIRKIIPGDEPKKLEIDLDELNAANFPIASAALTVAEKTIKQMKDLVETNLEKAQQFIELDEYDDDKFEEIMQNEAFIDKLDNSISNFLTELTIDHKSDDSVRINSLFLEIVKNLERIGDLSVNIAEFAKMVQEDKGSFSAQAHQELNEMFDNAHDMLNCAFKYIENKDIRDYELLMTIEARLDSEEYQARKNHFNRLITKECSSAVASSIYADVLGNIERIGDHCCNIARHAFESII